MRELMLKRAALALITVASFSGHATDPEKKVLRPLNELQAQAACETVRSTVVETAKKALDMSNENPDKTKVIRSTEQQVDKCAEATQEMYAILRGLGKEFLPFGYGRLIAGADINPVKVKNVGLGLRLGVGGSVFLALNGRFMLDFVVAPTGHINATAESVPYAKSIYEPQDGDIWYINPTLSNTGVDDFNGVYYGIGTEWLKPETSELKNREYKVITFYFNPTTMTGAVTYLSSKNGGKGELGKNLHGQAMYLYNMSTTGAGIPVFGSVAKPIVDETIAAVNKSVDVYNDTTQSISEKFKNLFNK